MNRHSYTTLPPRMHTYTHTHTHTHTHTRTHTNNHTPHHLYTNLFFIVSVIRLCPCRFFGITLPWTEVFPLGVFTEPYFDVGPTSCEIISTGASWAGFFIESTLISVGAAVSTGTSCVLLKRGKYCKSSSSSFFE